MRRILGSKKFLIYIWVFTLVTWIFVYSVGFMHAGLDAKAYMRGEKVETIGLGYFGKTTYGRGSFPLPEMLIIQTEDGRTLIPDEMVQVINPDLKPFVKDGRVYIYSSEGYSEWGEKVYWASANPVTTSIAKALRFIYRKS